MTTTTRSLSSPSTTTTTTATTDNKNSPLSLDELSRWVLPATLDWIRESDENEAAWQAANATELAGNGANLFASSEEDKDDDDKKDPFKYRVRTWCTSRTNPDGVFKYEWEQPQPLASQSSSIQKNNNGSVNSNNKNKEEDETRSQLIIYILSESWEGYGDILWASARHISNLLADATSCRQLLKMPPLANNDNAQQQHPLLGLSLVELGAGAGVPSWVAMHCGARVVCTDQAVPDRIRSIAECAERNYREIKDKDENSNSDNNNNNEPSILDMAKKARACALDWGGSVDQVLACLDKNKRERFDVIVAADCCYMPWLQPKLLDTMYALMSDRGVALIPFALHGNAKDEDVWGIVDRAKERGFETEILEPQQLTPPSEGMDSKQGLVQTVRLTKPQ